MASAVAAPAPGIAAPGAGSRGAPPCLVCREGVDTRDHRLVHAGRTVHVHAGDCRSRWEADPDAHFAALQARGALFDERSVAPDRLASGWLVGGVVVLLALISAAGAAYLAVGRGLPARRWFLAGLLAPIAGPVLAATRPRRPEAPTVTGLAKIPLTAAPSGCPGCGAANHPTARRCLCCGASLANSERSETERALRPTTT
jgi:hypothetical protein